MKRLIPAVCIAFAFTASAAAQTPASQPTDPQTPPSSQSMSSDKTVTLTGCVQEGDTPGTYVLANVDPSSIRGAGSSSAYGSPSSSPSTSSPSSTGTAGSAISKDKVKVELSDASNVNLKEHVGHQVSVTGTIAPAMGSSSGAAGTSGSTPSSSSASSSMGDKAKHKLSVKSVQMVSTSCST